MKGSTAKRKYERRKNEKKSTAKQKYDGFRSKQTYTKEYFEINELCRQIIVHIVRAADVGKVAK